MSRCRWLELLLSTALLLAEAAPVLCQPPSSIMRGPPPPHHVLDNLDTEIPAEDAFAARLQRVGEQLDSQNLLRQLLQDPSLLKKIQELKLNPKALQELSSLGDKDFRQALRLSLERKGTLSVEQLEKLKELVKPLLGGDLANLKPDDALPERLTPGKHSDPSAAPNPLQLVEPELSGPLGALFKPGSEQSKEFNELFSRLLTDMANTEAGRNALQQFGQANLSQEGGIKTKDLQTLFGFLPRLNGLWPKGGLNASDLAASLHNLQPRFGSHLELPSFSPPSLPSSTSNTEIVWVLLLVALGLLLWKSKEWLRTSRADQDASAWLLGDWPVAPTQVTTRADLIRAFEYLAFLCLGPTASTCHHRHVAARLGQNEGADAPQRRQAAEQLADLYEQARYAPEHAGQEPLPQHEQAAARQALCFLAGVTAA